MAHSPTAVGVDVVSAGPLTSDEVNSNMLTGLSTWPTPTTRGPDGASELGEGGRNGGQDRLRFELGPRAHAREGGGRGGGHPGAEVDAVVLGAVPSDRRPDHDDAADGVVDRVGNIGQGGDRLPVDRLDGGVLGEPRVLGLSARFHVADVHAAAGVEEVEVLADGADDAEALRQVGGHLSGGAVADDGEGGRAGLGVGELASERRVVLDGAVADPLDLVTLAQARCRGGTARGDRPDLPATVRPMANRRTP